MCACCCPYWWASWRPSGSPTPRLTPSTMASSMSNASPGSPPTPPPPKGALPRLLHGHRSALPCAWYVLQSGAWLVPFSPGCCSELLLVFRFIYIFLLAPYNVDSSHSGCSLDLVPISCAMASPVVTLPERVRIAVLRDILRSNRHNGFPIVRETAAGQVSLTSPP